MLVPDARVVAWVGVLATGCILEDNPNYGDSADEEAVATSTTGTDGSEGMATTGSSADMGSESEDGEESTGVEVLPPEDPVTQGCSESDCPELHVGFTDSVCPREDDSASDCDYFGPTGVQQAAVAAAEMGGAKIIVHDDDGRPAEYTGNFDVGGNTTLGAARGTPYKNVVLSWEPEGPGLIRIVGDDVHLHDLTLLCPEGCINAIRVISGDMVPVITGGHMFERLNIGGTHPELFGINQTQQPFSLGPDTIVRNSHIWGYWDGTIVLTDAPNLSIYNNTFVSYEAPDVLFDASEAESVSFVNNVFINLGPEIPAAMLVAEQVDGLVVRGNLFEGFGALVGDGLPDDGDPPNVVSDNVAGPILAEAPSNPVMLADADVVAVVEDDSIEGTSLDGVRLADAGAELVPGAFQRRSSKAGPRPGIVTLGGSPDGCGAAPCDHVQVDGDSLQLAVWSTWPGAQLQVFPGRYGGAVFTWGISLSGADPNPASVELSHRDTTGYLVRHDFFGRAQAILRVSPQGIEPTLVEGVTVVVGSLEHGVLVEADGSALLHEFSRLQLLSPFGNDAPSFSGLHLGDNVYAHDILVQGGFETCVRTGPREDDTELTPPSRTFVHNLTCRLTRALPEGVVMTAFDVASAVDSVWANVVVEMVDAGPLFRAQRRVGVQPGGFPDNGPNAFDPPLGFTAEAWLVKRPDGPNGDGFPIEDPTAFTLVDVTPIASDTDIFVGSFDNHLVGPGVDTGVDPTTLSEVMVRGISLDGIDRAERLIDLGCFEQGT